MFINILTDNLFMKISVIIPAHNEEKYIKKVLDALYKQNFSKKDFEIIVVQDNCTDKTWIEVDSYQRLRCEQYQDNIIRTIEVKKGSAAGARNAGAMIAKGKILVFQDADCIPSPTLLNNIVKHFENKDIEGLATRTTYIPPKNWIQSAVSLQRDLRWENNTRRIKKIGPNDGINVAVMKRGAFNRCGGYNEKIFYFEDDTLTKTFFKCGYKAIFAPDVIQYHNDPLTLKESFGQCKSIAKGMNIKQKAGKSQSLNEKISLWTAIPNIFIGIPFFPIFLISAIKSKEIKRPFYLASLISTRNIVKLYYYLKGFF